MLNGMNFSLNGTAVRFFGARGDKIHDNGMWAYNDGLGDDLVLLNPTSQMPEITDRIRSCVANGYGHRMAQLQFSPFRAVLFCLEGGLTMKHLSDAFEGPGYIDIPNVRVNGYVLTARVLQYPAYDSIVVADGRGNLM